MASNTNVNAIILSGGLNLASSVLEVKPGQCTQLFNYEVNTLGRYQRVLGYERFDGQPAPSAVVARELSGAPFDDDAVEFAAVEAERALRRAAIGKVPGSGRILGIFVLAGKVYAFRNTDSGSTAKLYCSSAGGWVEISTPTLSPHGDYRFVETNFIGSAGAKEIVGVDGVNKAFRFDGTTFTQLTGPIEPDAPIDCEALSSQTLLLAYRGGSFVFSAVGDPTKYSPVDGGGEIGCADEIVKLQRQANNSCAVFCRNRTYVLYGRSKSDFQLEDLSKDTGAIPGSVQAIGDSVYLDDRGLTRLDRVQAFGNFDMATISQLIDPLLSRYSTRVTTSFSLKKKNQYRLCFDDGTGIIVTFLGREVAGFSTFDFGLVVRCAYSGEGDSGREVSYFGSDDGYVYQLERGFTFDGEKVPFVCRPAFVNFGSVEYKKRFRKVVVEADTIGTATIFITPDFDYSDPGIPFHQSQEVVVLGSGGYWDSATWDEMRWSSAVTFTADAYIDGVARNVSITVSGEAENEPPHILNSLIIHHSPRGRRR
jgi:hypothetical protein